MNKIWVLTKVFLKSSFQFDTENKNTSSRLKKIAAKIGYGILILYLIGIFSFLSYQLIETLRAFGQETLFVGIFLLALLLLISIQTIFSAMNIFYFAKDIEQVLPLPIKPIELLLAKLNVLIISEYLIEFIFGLFPIFIYGYITGAGIIYYIISLVVLLLLPIVPILFITLVVMVIMRFSNLVKYKERFQLFINLAIILLAIGLQFFFTSTGEVSNQEILVTMTNVNGMVESIGNYFLVLKPAIHAIINTNEIIPLLQLIAFTLISFIIFICIGNKIYFKGVIGSRGTALKKRKMKDKNYQEKDIGLSYVIKEFKLLIRNPIYFIQCILPAFLMPVLLFLPFLGNDNGMDIRNIAGLFNIQSPLGISILLSIISFLYSLNFIAITGISRDGENAKFVKQIPVSLYDQYIYKIIPAVFVNFIPSLILIGLVYYLFPVSIGFIVVIFLFTILFSFIHSIWMLWIDLKRPKLNWNTEYAVVKQNMNMLFEFIFSFICIAIFLLIGYLCMTINEIIFILIFTFILTIALLFSNRYIRKKQDILFDKIN